MGVRPRVRLLAIAGAVCLLLGSCTAGSEHPSGNATLGTPSGTASSEQPPGASGSATAPAVTATLPPNLLGKDIEVIPTSQKVVALTFDAGANADGLSSILSTLAGQHVPATFFLTGSWAKAYPAAVKNLATAGYRLGNHTATHAHLPALSDTAITGELSTGRSQIMAAGGSDPRPLFRFPFGDRTAHTIAVVNAAGYIPVRWTVDTLGWKGTSGGVTTQTVINRTVAGARPGEIVLMHVGSNPDDHTTLDAAALPTVIAKLKALGYGFVTLDALLNGTSSGGGVVGPGCDSLAWRTAPVTVSHNPAVPPVPTVTGVRAGTHPECRYDRVVFDITGPLPAYEIRYVTHVTADPSGKAVTVPGGGTAYLLVTLHPAQAHNDAGAATITVRSAALGYPSLKGYTVTEDFEGYVSIALGLASHVQIRVGELTGRLYVDVAYT